MPFYRVGAKGLKIMRRDNTVIDYPPGQLVWLIATPPRYQGELTLVEQPDPKRGEVENKMKRPAEDKAAE